MPEYKDLAGKVIAKGAESCGYPADMTGGRKYGLGLAEHQMVGGYKAQPDMRVRPPADSVLAKRYHRGVDNFGRHERNPGKIDVRGKR